MGKYCDFFKYRNFFKCCDFFKYRRICEYLLNTYLYLKNVVTDTYKIFFKNIYLYFRPIEIQLVYDSFLYNFYPYNKNIYYDETRYLYFYKINRVDYKEYKFYNYGYYYHVSNNMVKNSDLPVENVDFAYAPDTIEYIKVTLKPTDVLLAPYTIEIHDKLIGNLMSEKFINSILSFSTKQTNLEPLLYYFLQTYLSNNDKIISATIKLELDDVEKTVNINENIETIYTKIE